MRIIVPLLFIILFHISTAFGQTNSNVKILRNHYENFEYSSVIIKANSMLLEPELFSDENLIIIYTITAASYYAINDFNNSRKMFIELLKIDESFELDNILYSPKLVSFFNSIKNEFLDIRETNKSPEFNALQSDSKNDADTIAKKSDIKMAIAQSVLLPGLGHLHLESKTKGWILTTTSAALIGSAIYFIIQTNRDEENYLAETNTELINSKYESFNKSYKIRNTLIVTYAALWLYSQIDLLFFSNSLGSKYISSNDGKILFNTTRGNAIVSLKIEL